MTVSRYFDATPATWRKNASATINDTTGKFVDPTETLQSIVIHVSKPKMDEALPGGMHVQDGDLVVHADASLTFVGGDILEFWDGVWIIVTPLRRYDVLQQVLQYSRRAFLVRRHGEYDNAP